MPRKPTVSDEEIYSVLKYQPRMTLSEVGHRLGVSERTIHRHTRRLRQDGRIEYTAGRWWTQDKPA